MKTQKNITLRGKKDSHRCWAPTQKPHGNIKARKKHRWMLDREIKQSCNIDDAGAGDGDGGAGKGSGGDGNDGKDGAEVTLKVVVTMVIVVVTMMALVATVVMAGKSSVKACRVVIGGSANTPLLLVRVNASLPASSATCCQ